jgi:hypothetical protein
MQDIRSFFANATPGTQSAPSTSSQEAPAAAAAANPIDRDELDSAEPASTRRRLDAEQPSPFTAKLQTGKSKCGLCGCVPPPSRTLYSVAMTNIWSACRKNGVSSLCLCSGCHIAHGSKLVIPMDSARAEAVGNYIVGRLLLRSEPQAAELLLTASQRRKRLCNVKADDDKFFGAVIKRSTEVAETRLLLELALLRDCGSSHRLQSRLYGGGLDLTKASADEVEALIVSSYIRRRPDLAYEKVWSQARLERAVRIVVELQNKTLGGILDSDLLRPFSKQLVQEDYAFLCIKGLMRPIRNRPPFKFLGRCVINAPASVSENRLGSQWSFRYLAQLESWASWSTLLKDVNTVLVMLDKQPLAAGHIAHGVLKDLFASWCDIVELHVKRLVREGKLNRALFRTERQKLGCEFRKSLVGTLVYCRVAPEATRPQTASGEVGLVEEAEQGDEEPSGGQVEVEENES